MAPQAQMASEKPGDPHVQPPGGQRLVVVRTLEIEVDLVLSLDAVKLGPHDLRGRAGRVPGPRQEQRGHRDAVALPGAVRSHQRFDAAVGEVLHRARRRLAAHGVAPDCLPRPIHPRKGLVQGRAALADLQRSEQVLVLRLGGASGRVVAVGVRDDDDDAEADDLPEGVAGRVDLAAAAHAVGVGHDGERARGLLVAREEDLRVVLAGWRPARVSADVVGTGTKVVRTRTRSRRRLCNHLAAHCVVELE
mmetsp:Transcript_5390/g.10989  ORF Transcript_5390/g.10989 Transcript_5390/m.10989 type:complete len:249 (+) Transcript_5390:624-1370(+)